MEVYMWLSRSGERTCARLVEGMVDSKEFVVGIFDALARRRRQNLERISKDELYEFWLQISRYGRTRTGDRRKNSKRRRTNRRSVSDFP
jgi:hypothetical protein